VLLTFAFLSMHTASANTPIKAGDEYNYQLEFSFGSSLLFTEQPLWNQTQQRNEYQVMPVSSVLILGEYIFHTRWSWGNMLNIPTSTKRFLVDGSIVEEYSSPSIGTGITYKPIVKKIFDDRASFRLQVGALIGYAINNPNHTFFPLAVVRPSLSTPKGFSMYVGTAFSAHVQSIALVYGVSQLF
jgi:hypothetical protein